MSPWDRIVESIQRYALAREPTIYIGGQDNPYLIRWELLPKNRWFNVYLHKFVRSDDDRALHDHPWCSLSLLLAGSYVEHTIAPGGVHKRRRYNAGALKFMSGSRAHRVEVVRPCWTLFIRGPNYREWGFHCPLRGWVHWERFCKIGDTGSIGAGCDG